MSGQGRRPPSAESGDRVQASTPRGDPGADIRAAKSAVTDRARTARARAIRDAALAAAAVLSVLALWTESRLGEYRRHPRYREMAAAAAAMERASEAVAALRLERGFRIDEAADPNGTGLIGLEYSGVTTTLGDLAAKRTTALPDMAALMASLLDEAGASPGSLIAVGASGSFPGATLATLAAARALGLDVALIASLGSSSWGANVPGFSYLEMHAAAEPRLGYGLIAASAGGDDDSGSGMDPLDLAALNLAIDRSPSIRISEPDAASAARRRLELYRSYAAGRPYAAFVNIGGGVADLGPDGALALRPGLNLECPPGVGGVVRAMADDGAPILNILDLRSLSAARGLAWDPVPPPKPGTSAVYLVRDPGVYARRLVALCAAYAAGLAVIALAAKAATRRAAGGAALSPGRASRRSPRRP